MTLAALMYFRPPPHTIPLTVTRLLCVYCILIALASRHADTNSLFFFVVVVVFKFYVAVVPHTFQAKSRTTVEKKKK